MRALRKQMREQGIDAMLVTHLPDVRYVCGFTGSNAALAVTAKRAAMFTDGRYTSQSKEETLGARVVIAKKSALREACAWLEEPGVAAAYFDPEQTTVAALEIMRDALSKGKRRGFFQALKKPIVSELRMVKDADELLLMERAALLGCNLFTAVLPHMQAGVTESEIAADLEFFARSMGAEGMSFETIVASGKRSALPHGRATTAKVPGRGFVTLDFGVILNGYCSDMTRTVHMGKPGREEQSAYEAVLEAQEAAVAAVKPGATCGEVDEAARSVLRGAKLDKYFTHSTGHGVGIEIHESPRVAAEQKQVLEPGMVITIEPGVYIEGKFGIRIEDMVAVTKSGGKILTPAPKAMIQL
ncbi:aminopeptidase P family protein [Alloacidobacterium dinghuense]|uniref:Aminopeptidase P family protein n=1 Tax=Alloacidobacterium dinghuense TaxID=2763107 RepID=A0A7G8BQY0_9BACT|nr:aminopeptidase P family protein [Alloacidobacterium dinghuense]